MSRARPRPFRPLACTMWIMRALWSGHVTCGLVSVPVHLYAATEEMRPHLHHVHTADGSSLGEEHDTTPVKVHQCSSVPVWLTVVGATGVAPSPIRVISSSDHARCFTPAGSGPWSARCRGRSRSWRRPVPACTPWVVQRTRTANGPLLVIHCGDQVPHRGRHRTPADRQCRQLRRLLASRGAGSLRCVPSLITFSSSSATSRLSDWARVLMLLA